MFTYRILTRSLVFLLLSCCYANVIAELLFVRHSAGPVRGRSLFAHLFLREIFSPNAAPTCAFYYFLSIIITPFTYYDSPLHVVPLRPSSAHFPFSPVLFSPSSTPLHFATFSALIPKYKSSLFFARP